MSRMYENKSLFQRVVRFLCQAAFPNIGRYRLWLRECTDEWLRFLLWRREFLLNNFVRYPGWEESWEFDKITNDCVSLVYIVKSVLPKLLCDESWSFADRAFSNFDCGRTPDIEEGVLEHGGRSISFMLPPWEPLRNGARWCNAHPPILCKERLYDLCRL